MKKVKIKSDGTFKPIQKLINLGYKNIFGYTGKITALYYYGLEDKNIRMSTDESIDLHNYEEIFLSDEDLPVEIKNIKKMLVSHDGEKWTERYVVATYKGKAICITKGSSETFEKERRLSHTLVWRYYKELPEFNPEPGTWIYVSDDGSAYVKRLFLRKYEGKFYCLYAGFFKKWPKNAPPDMVPTLGWNKAMSIKDND